MMGGGPSNWDKWYNNNFTEDDDDAKIIKKKNNKTQQLRLRKIKNRGKGWDFISGSLFVVENL